MWRTRLRRRYSVIARESDQIEGLPDFDRSVRGSLHSDDGWFVVDVFDRFAIVADATKFLHYQQAVNYIFGFERSVCFLRLAAGCQGPDEFFIAKVLRY